MVRELQQGLLLGLVSPMLEALAGSNSCLSVACQAAAVPPSSLKVSFLTAAAALPDCHHVGCRQVGCLWPQVKAFIDLVGSLLSASMPPPTGPRGMRPAAQPLATEIVRTMQDTGIVKPLINALKLVDTNHPQVNAALQLAPDPDSHLNAKTDF